MKTKLQMGQVRVVGVRLGGPHIWGRGLPKIFNSDKTSGGALRFWGVSPSNFAIRIILLGPSNFGGPSFIYTHCGKLGGPKFGCGHKTGDCYSILYNILETINKGNPIRLMPLVKGGLYGWKRIQVGSL